MTDNRTTELRRLLDERGVEYEANRLDFDGGNYNIYTEWGDISYVEYADGTVLRIFDCTPEQAIAATLGNGRHKQTCHAESDLSEWVCSNCQCWIPLGLTPENIKHASEWRYCPHCGAKVLTP